MFLRMSEISNVKISKFTKFEVCDFLCFCELCDLLFTYQHLHPPEASLPLTCQVGQGPNFTPLHMSAISTTCHLLLYFLSAKRKGKTNEVFRAFIVATQVAIDKNFLPLTWLASPLSQPQIPQPKKIHNTTQQICCQNRQKLLLLAQFLANLSLALVTLQFPARPPRHWFLPHFNFHHPITLRKKISTVNPQ